MTDDHSDDHSKDKRAAGGQNLQPAHRPWRQLAEAVLRETDSDKILRLAQELCDAVDEQVVGNRKKPGDG